MSAKQPKTCDAVQPTTVADPIVIEDDAGEELSHEKATRRQLENKPYALGKDWHLFKTMECGSEVIVVCGTINVDQLPDELRDNCVASNDEDAETAKWYTDNADKIHNLNMARTHISTATRFAKDCRDAQKLLKQANMTIDEELEDLPDFCEFKHFYIRPRNVFEEESDDEDDEDDYAPFMCYYTKDCYTTSVRDEIAQAQITICVDYCYVNDLPHRFALRLKFVSEGGADVKVNPRVALASFHGVLNTPLDLAPWVELLKSNEAIFSTYCAELDQPSLAKCSVLVGQYSFASHWLAPTSALAKSARIDTDGKAKSEDDEDEESREDPNVWDLILFDISEIFGK